ncbi:MAG: pilin [Patescibacteria group bacterium]
MKKIIFWGISLAPVLAFAADIETDVVRPLQGILDALIPLLMVAAFVVFLWGIVKFITSGGDEEKKKSAKSLIIYGLIGLFVMVAVWGIIKLVQGTFGVTQTDINLPGSPKPPIQ